MNDEDKGLFQREMRDVQPLSKKHEKKVHPSMLTQRRKKSVAVLQSKNALGAYCDPITVTPVEPEQCLTYKSNGISQSQFNKLRQGRILFEARLDLHQCSCAQAKKRMNEFIEMSKARNFSCCLIIHGKGQGLVKGITEHVLREHHHVVAFHSAKPNHGGMGALYVLFRGFV